MKLGTRTVLAALLLVGGCGGEEVPLPDPTHGEPALAGPRAGLEATLIDGEAGPVGVVTFAPGEDGGVHIQGRIVVPTLAGGLRGFHLHETGRCDPPEFESAGGHYNPHDAPHGGPSDPPRERHAGDLGNLEFDAEGVAEPDLHMPDLELEELVGLAVVVHRDADDLTTDPAGDAGPRIACGVIRE
jgi:superoxide dismutase, Cu-Zn family